MHVRTVTPTELFTPYYDIISNPKLPWGPERMMTMIERKCVLSVALQHDQGKAKLEFGTWEGYMTALLAKVFPGSTIYTIDLPESVSHQEHPHRDLGHHYMSSECANVVQFLEDSRSFKPQIPQCDFVLVDANHVYEWVINDISIALGVLCDGGCLMLDDCFLDGPKRASQELLPSADWIQIEGTKLVFCTVTVPKV